MGEVLGVVLAGGGSSRLGRDKASLGFGGPAERDVTWLDRAARLAEDLCGEVLVVGRITPRHRSLRDERAGAGPLGGIETALAAASGRAIFSLPCDLPLLTAEDLHPLLDQRDPASELTALRHRDGAIEPLVAIWEPAVRASLSDYLDEGQRAAHAFLRARRVTWVEIDPEADERFANVNTPEDLEHIRQLSGRAPSGGPCDR